MGVEGARQLALGLADNATLVSLNLEWQVMRFIFDKLVVVYLVFLNSGS